MQLVRVQILRTVCRQVLVDGPSALTGLQRQVITLKRLTLTDLKVDIQRQARYAFCSSHCRGFGFNIPV